jgi:hypothetical protein
VRTSHARQPLGRLVAFGIRVKRYLALLSLILCVANAAAPSDPTKVVLSFRTVSLDGGTPPDLHVVAAQYLGLGAPAPNLGKNLAAALSPLFPIGMKRDAVIAKLRPIREAHLWDTSVGNWKFGERLQNGVALPGEVSFQVFTYLRTLVFDDSGKEWKGQESVCRETLTITIQLDRDDCVSGYLAGVDTGPI